MMDALQFERIGANLSRDLYKNISNRLSLLVSDLNCLNKCEKDNCAASSIIVYVNFFKTLICNNYQYEIESHITTINVKLK